MSSAASIARRVLVTGGAGKVGKAVVERLVRSGRDVLVVGRASSRGVEGARYAACDVTDAGALAAAMEGRDAVVHLAAVPGPLAGAPQEVFRVNATGTFNVYAAAARAGIRRVVTASSINAYGSQFGLSPMPVTALPLVEEDPGRTTDAYSFSKQVVEATARYAWRRDGIGGTCLRLPGVVPPHFSARETVLPHAERCRASLAALRALPPGERAARVASWVAHRDAWRVHAPWNDPVAPRGYEWPDPLAEGWPDFFTRIDERDAAQAVEKSLDAPYEGMHVLNVNDSCTVTGVPSLELAALFFPGARLRVDRLQSTASLVSIDAARALIGFEPEHSVGRWFAES